MVTILQLADSRVGATPMQLQARRADLWAGLSRAVDAAIDLGCDAIVHSGGLVEHDIAEHDIADDVARALQPAIEAGMRVIVCAHSEDAQHAPSSVDGIELVAVGESVDVGGVAIVNAGTGVAVPYAAPTDVPWIAAVWGRIDGIAGIVRGAPELEAASIAELAERATWVAAGGVGRYARIAPRAAYAPATAQANSWDAGDAGGGVLLEVDPAAAPDVPPRVTQVVWPDRPRASIRIDAGRMDTRLVAVAVAARLSALQDLAPQIGPLSLAASVLPQQLRGTTARGPASPDTLRWYERAAMGWTPEGMLPWERPIISVDVRGTHASLTDLRLADKLLDRLFDDGTQLACAIKLGGGGFTPVLPDRELQALHPVS
jgi:hypothetical protein